MNLKIAKPIRLIELFAGIGSQAKALERLGANFEHYRISEWEVNAAASYKAIHKKNDNTDYSAEFTDEQLTEILFNIGISTDGKKPLGIKEIARKNEGWKRSVYNTFKVTNNVGSILKIKGDDLGIVDTDKFCYLLTYSFPCQDLSLAGKGKGMAKGDNTRSGLLWEVERLLNECEELPQILLMENVTQVHGKKNKEHFEEWIQFLESKGYSNYWKDLNAKNFGIPQNRDRTFMVSVLGGFSYEFPKEFPLELRLKDILEDSVDEKFYLSEKMVNFFYENTKKQQAKGNGFRFSPTNGDGCGKAITTRAGARMDDNFISEQQSIDPFIARSQGRNPENPSDRRAGIPTKQRLEPNFSGCSNTLTTVQKDNYVVEPFINVVGNYSPSGHDASRIVDENGLAPTVKENHGTVTAVLEPLAYDEQNGYIRKDGTVGTLTCDGSSPKHNNRVVENTHIRKLTPKECWRLMGFNDADFEKAASVNSNTQLYKQAGNSIVVDVLYYIFRGML